MTDGRVLHFLKSFPAWIVLTTLFLIVLYWYATSGDQFFQRLVDTILGALLGILTGRWTAPPAPSANTNSGDVIVTPNPNLKDLSDGEINDAVQNIGEKQ